MYAGRAGGRFCRAFAIYDRGRHAYGSSPIHRPRLIAYFVAYFELGSERQTSRTSKFIPVEQGDEQGENNRGGETSIAVNSRSFKVLCFQPFALHTISRTN